MQEEDNNLQNLRIRCNYVFRENCLLPAKTFIINKINLYDYFLYTY